MPHDDGALISREKSSHRDTPVPPLVLRPRSPHQSSAHVEYTNASTWPRGQRCLRRRVTTNDARASTWPRGQRCGTGCIRRDAQKIDVRSHSGNTTASRSGPRRRQCRRHRKATRKRTNDAAAAVRPGGAHARERDDARSHARGGSRTPNVPADVAESGRAVGSAYLGDMHACGAGMRLYDRGGALVWLPGLYPLDTASLPHA